MLITSLKTSAEISAATNPWWVYAPTLDNYAALLSSAQFLTFFRNSAVVSVLVVSITMLISVPAAFALSRMRFWGSASIATGVFLSYLVPETLLFLPLFKMFAVFCGRHIDWQENVKLWNDLRGWAGANAAALRLSFRMTVAGLLAYVLAKLFTLPQGYWAVFSAIIIMQASVGGSVKSTIDRVIGTIGGAVAGGTVGYLLPHESV